MNYLFFDVETNGLPSDFNQPYTNLDNWPRIVQIAWSIYSSEGKEIESKDYIICPQDFYISKESSDIHGISQDIALERGIQLKKVLLEFYFAASNCEVFVAHNMDFDFPIIMAELLRCDIIPDFERKIKICTMKSPSIINYCKLKNNKWPKLSELHFCLFGEDFNDKHNAKSDVDASARCFFELKKMNIINL